MTNFDVLLDAVGKVGEKLNEIPEARECLAKVQRGEATVEETVLSLIAILKERGLVEEVAGAALAVPEVSSNLSSFILEDEAGNPRLNPIYEAAILERASLDGDVPEFRYGPLPEGARPAVPVLTTCLDPVLVGAMLEQASQNVLALFEEANAAHEEECRAMVQQGKEVPPAPTGVVGYRAGQFPQPLSVSPPARVSISDEKAREYNYRALATTQGRVSLALPIAHRVLQSLQAAGVEVASGHPKETLFSASWDIQVWGQEDFSHAFNHAEVACVSISEKLLLQLSQAEPRAFLLEVLPLHGISDRTFGWVANLGLA